MSTAPTTRVPRRLPARPPTLPADLAREEKELRALLEGVDWSLSEAGKALGRTAADVWRMLRKFPALDKERQTSRKGAMRSGRKPILTGRRQLRDALRAAGWDLGKVAEELGASKRTVRDWLVRYELEDTYRRVRERAATSSA